MRIEQVADGDEYAYILLRDEQVSGVNGGDFISGSWQTRVLNTKVVDSVNIADLAANQITLPAGTYRVKAHTPANSVSFHKAKLRNITDGTDLVIGTSEYTHIANYTYSCSFVEGQFVLADSKVLELQHRCASTRTINGLGGGCAFGVIEVYAVIEFWKIN